MGRISGIFGLLLVVVGLAASALMANRLYDWKIAHAPHEAHAPTQFYAGMDKFLSNVSWMTLIQWQADASQRQMTPAVSEALFRKLNALTNLDPLFTDAYLNGALTLAPHDPARSIQLLDKAILMGAGENWKVPFYAGHVQATVNHDHAQAVRYFEMAVRDNQAPDYVRTALIRSKCHTAGNDPAASIRLWHDYFKSAPEANTTQRRMAATEIREHAAALTTQIQEKLQSATDPTTRESIRRDQEWLTQVLQEVDAAVPPTPRDAEEPEQPNI